MKRSDFMLLLRVVSKVVVSLTILIKQNEKST